MNALPKEIVNHIFYFTENNIFELSLVNHYFNDNLAAIRIVNNEKYRSMEDHHILKLTNLQSLDLPGDDPMKQYKNKITNEGIDNITIGNFISLNLEFNETIISISRLTNLIELNLSCNDMLADSDLNNLTNLTNLNLSCNDMITDKSVSKLTNLTHLDLTGNYRITLQCLKSLPKLVSIVTWSDPNGISTVAENVGELHNLTALRIMNNNSITDDTIKKLTKLKTLSIDYLITNEGISDLTNLTDLGVFFNKDVTDKGISNLVNLESIMIKKNGPINEQGLSHLTNLTNIRYYKINGHY